MATRNLPLGRTPRLRRVFLMGGLAMLMLWACDAPGEGPKAERGYRRSAPVIAALERYRQARGAYPDSLAMLVPAFLPQGALAVPENSQERYPLDYRSTPGGYELTFRYTGPGVNDCTYTPHDKHWDCGGHF